MKVVVAAGFLVASGACCGWGLRSLAVGDWDESRRAQDHALGWALAAACLGLALVVL